MSNVRIDCQLIAAAKAGDEAKVIELLEQGADPSNPHFMEYTNEDTALNVAAQNGHISVVEKLLAAKADIDLHDWNLGSTALTLAANFGHASVVHKLLNAQANLEEEDVNSESALMCAAKSCHMEVVDLLLAANANPDLQGSNGSTALMRAAWEGQYDIVERLVCANAALDLQDIVGYTALMAASNLSQDSVVELLLAAKADFNLKTSEGRTALDLALANDEDDDSKNVMAAFEKAMTSIVITCQLSTDQDGVPSTSCSFASGETIVFTTEGVNYQFLANKIRSEASLPELGRLVLVDTTGTLLWQE
mmetsp:Transcript_103585/g.198838  ORF Transcript_103585/g.198838 Transcript_103585/m.198838 type:complete len:307 (+) Transcript_103585:26-946(+)